MRLLTRAAILAGTVASLYAIGTTPVAASDAPLINLGGPMQCGDACSLEWAAAEIGAPVLTPQRMVAPAGTVVDNMAFAAGGRAIMSSRDRTLARDEPGIGYRYMTIDGWRVMFRPDACGNWSDYALARGGLATFNQTGHSLGSRGAVPTFVGGLGGAGGSFKGTSSGGTSTIPPITPILTSEPPDRPVSPNPVPPVAPSPISLPGAVWLLLGALATIAALRRI